jgi:hypothetical protein
MAGSCHCAAMAADSDPYDQLSLRQIDCFQIHINLSFFLILEFPAHYHKKKKLADIHLLRARHRPQGPGRT